MNIELLTAADAKKKAEFYRDKKKWQEEREKYDREFNLERMAERTWAAQCQRIHEIISVKAKEGRFAYSENVNPYNIYLITRIQDYFKKYGYKVAIDGGGFTITW